MSRVNPTTAQRTFDEGRTFETSTGGFTYSFRFNRVRSRLMKANTAPLFGSSCSRSLTAAQSPLKDLRMSTGCTAT